jgi:hypothetical protein
MSCFMRLDQQTHMTKLIVPFSNFAKTTKSSRLFETHVTIPRNFNDPQRSTAAASRTFKINHRKIADFPDDFD